MYLHLGQDVVVLQSDIIGIFDLDNTSVSKLTREFLKESEKNNCVINVSTQLPRSFIVLKNKKVYISQISPSTLKKRSKKLILTDN